MNAIIERLWQKAEPALYISKEEFIHSLSGWKIEPVVMDGQLAFVTLVRGPAFHFVSFETGHSLSRRAIRAFLQQIIDRHGYVTTKTPKDDLRQHRFNRKLGFKAVGMDEFDIIYRIDRGGPCH